MHGPGSRETADSIPLQREDLARFPDVWRRPDRVRSEGAQDRLVTEQDAVGDTEYKARRGKTRDDDGKDIGGVTGGGKDSPHSPMSTQTPDKRPERHARDW